MNKDILGNLYYHVGCVYPINRIIHMHLHHDYDKLNRKYYKINDLKLWFESDFKKGEELYIRRVSEKGKYLFR